MLIILRIVEKKDKQRNSRVQLKTETFNNKWETKIMINCTCTFCSVATLLVTTWFKAVYDKTVLLGGGGGMLGEVMSRRCPKTKRNSCKAISYNERYSSFKM